MGMFPYVCTGCGLTCRADKRRPVDEDEDQEEKYKCTDQDGHQFCYIDCVYFTPTEQWYRNSPDKPFQVVDAALDCPMIASRMIYDGYGGCYPEENEGPDKLCHLIDVANKPYIGYWFQSLPDVCVLILGKLTCRDCVEHPGWQKEEKKEEKNK